MKKILLIILALLIIAIAYYLLSPLWHVVPVDDAIPTLPPYNFTNVTPTISLPTLTPGSATGSGSIVPSAERSYSGVDKLTPVQKAEMDAQSAQMTPMPKTEYPIAGMISVVGQGNFVAAAHDVAGSAQLLDYPEEKILRFENFKTINGPDLRIYLSSGKDVRDAIDLGPIRGTVGNVNYVVKKDIDTAKYSNVLVWCRAFGVLFSYAELK